MSDDRPLVPFKPDDAYGPEEMRRYTYKRWTYSVKQRGLECLMSFEDWWYAWRDHWPDRTRLDLVLARRNDEGPYKLGNVYITSRGQNARDAVAAKRRRREAAEGVTH